MRRVSLRLSTLLRLGILLEQSQYRLQLLADTLPTPLSHTERVVQRNRGEDIEEDICEDDPVISPAGAVRDGDGIEVLVCGCERAVRAVRCVVRIGDLTSCGGGEG